MGTEILGELRQTLSEVSDGDCRRLMEMIDGAERIFVTGCGRSMLMMRCFAMRLMQLGYRVYVAGDTCTPAIGAGDLLIAASGSGRTGSVRGHMETARRVGASTACFTLFPDSPIGQLCDPAIRIPGTTAKSEAANGFQSVQLVGSTFEQSVLILCDAMSARLAAKRADDFSIMHIHANLE